MQEYYSDYTQHIGENGNYKWDINWFKDNRIS